MSNPILMIVVTTTLLLAADGEIADFRVKDLNNHTVAYSELKGARLTIIDFWATWCKPCTRSIPKLQALHEKYEGRGVQFIGINVDGTRSLSKVKPMSKSLGITYPVLLDVNHEVMKQLKVTAMPSVLVIDQKDKVIAFHQGYRPGDEEVLEQEIIAQLEKDTAVDEKN